MSLEVESTQFEHQPTKRRRCDPSLTEEQDAVLQDVLEGYSIFVTGSAGTGKSFLLKKCIEQLRSLVGDSKLAITAPTGIAAVALGGSTIHAFGGVGLGIESAEELAYQARRSRKARARWQMTEILIVDEVSMLEGELFDKLDYVGRKIRNCDRPFGGIQLVLCGDFFQLPPVTKMGKAKVFAFETKAWKASVQKSFELTQVFRQHEGRFIQLLNEIRVGSVSSEASEALAACADRQLDCSDGIESTRLFCRKVDVANENLQRLNALPTKEHRYLAEDFGQEGTSAFRQIQEHCPGATEVVLKEGAQVVLLKNLDVARGLANGSRGVVVGFEPKAGGGKDPLLPRVRFINGSVNLIERHEWTVELNGVKLAGREQVPLALAWSLTIHKAQGMTIDRLEVNLRDVFECGQAYVALSRATSLETLRVMAFDPARVFADDKVKQFYKSLRSATANPSSSSTPSDPSSYLKPARQQPPPSSATDSPRPPLHDVTPSRQSPMHSGNMNSSATRGSSRRRPREPRQARNRSDFRRGRGQGQGQGQGQLSFSRPAELSFTRPVAAASRVGSRSSDPISLSDS